MRKTIVSMFSEPASSRSGTDTSYPEWNFKSKPSIGFTAVTEQGRSLRSSPASRIAKSEGNRLTFPPRLAPVIGIWARKHAQLRNATLQLQRPTRQDGLEQRG